MTDQPTLRDMLADAQSDWDAIGESESLEHEKELCCEWVLNHAESLLAELTTLRADRDAVDGALRVVFLHGHAEGWTGNQTRRDVQNVDAEKGWSLYVSNGALDKTLRQLKDKP